MANGTDQYADRITQLLTQKTPRIQDVATAFLGAAGGRSTFGEALNAQRANELAEAKTLYEVMSSERRFKFDEKRYDFEVKRLEAEAASEAAKVGRENFKAAMDLAKDLYKDQPAKQQFEFYKNLGQAGLKEDMPLEELMNGVLGAAGATGFSVEHDIKEVGGALYTITTDENGVPRAQLMAGSPQPKSEAESALDKKVQMIMGAYGTDYQTAVGVATGAKSVVPDQTYGGVHIVDEVTGTSQYLPGTSEIPAPAPGESALPSDIDYTQGTGLSGVAGGVANFFTDLFAGKLAAPEVERGKEALKQLGVRTRTALGRDVTSRPTNWLMQQLDALTVTPASIFQGDARAQERLIQTRDMIQAEIDRIDRDLIPISGTLSRKDIAEITLSRSELQKLLSDYNMIVESMQAASSGAEVGSPAPEGVDPELWIHLTPAERDLWRQ